MPWCSKSVYNYINKLATVDINVVSGEANVTISDGFLNIAYATYGKNTIEFVENLIHHNDNLNAVDLLDTIEILKNEIEKI